MKKKLIRFVAMMMLLFVISLFQEQLVFADDKDYEWIKNNDETVTIRMYKGSDTDVIIPDKLDGKTVTGIGKGAFLNKLITSVTFPASLTKIDNLAFSGSRLTTVTFPPGLTSIGEYAFDNNRLISITLPASLTKIGRDAFSGNNLTTVTLPDDLMNIDNYAFSTNELTTVKLPRNLKSIGEHAFFKNALTSVELPPDLTSIGDYAFSQNQLVNVNFPSNLKVIGNHAFHTNKLTTAELPFGVKSLGDYSFYQNALTSIKLPSDLTSIGDYAFFGNKLTTVEFPSRLRSIGNSAFYQNALTTVKFPSSLTSIGNYTFFKNELTSIELPSNLTSVGAYAFYFNPLTTVTLPRNLRDIGDAAFYNNQLTTAKFLSETVYIGDDAFNRPTGVRDVTIYGYPSSSAKNYALNKGHKFIPYYKVIYNGNGMTSGSEPVYSNPYEKDAEVRALGDGGMQKVGFTFDGWNTLADGTGVDYAVNGVFQMGEEDVTLYAKWILNKYTIEFDSANGSVVNEVTADHDTKISAPTPPVKQGHTFVGWYTDINDSSQWNFDEDKVGKDMTLYAKWALDKYTVKFNPNNDSVIDDVDVDYGTKISAPKDPQKLHHTFMGWYTNTDYLNEWDFNSHPVQGNMMLYAKWTVNKYTVTFDSKNGSTLDDVIADYATKISIPTAPVKIGYTFSGWYKDASFQSPWDFSVDEVQDHITLHAKWQYTVKFDTDGGSAIVDALVDPAALLSPPPVPTKLGHIFVGWYTGVELTNEWDFTADKVQADMTLYAKWTVNGYTIKFDSQGGSIVNDIAADYATRINAPTEPTRPSHIFAGWYTDTALTTAWDFTADKVQANMTLYAKWTVNSPIITIDYVHAIADIHVPVSADTASINLPANVIVTLSDMTKSSIPVTWDDGTPVFDGNTPGNYLFTGTLTPPTGVTNPKNLQANVNAIVQSAGIGTDTEAPKWPAGSDISLTDITTTSIRLSWPAATDNIAVISYRIYVDGIEKALVGNHEHSYVVTGVNTKTTYNFSVQAYDAAGNASMALEKSGTTLSPPLNPDNDGGSGNSGSSGSDYSGSEPSYVPSNNTNLQELKVFLNGQMLTLTPEGSAFTLKTEASEIELFPTTAHSAAKVTLNGNPLIKGQKTLLHEGTNIFELTIEAENGTKKTYTVTIQRTPTEQVAPPIVPVEPDPVEPVNPVPPIEFDDTTGHWAEEYIQQATTLGILKGYPDGTFKPNNPLTRAQAASIIVRALHLQTDEAAPFKDIGNYADETQAEIAAAYQFGIIKGSNGNFKPSDKITRAQIALMIQRAYEYKTGTKYDADKAPYSDFGNYDAETINAISMLHELGIATGSEGKFNPGNQTTRAQAAKIFVNLLASLK